MIITIKGSSPDIFKDSNIGTLSTWTISRVLGDGATYNGVTYVDKNAAFSATVTIAEGYNIGSAGVTVTMGGATQSGAATTSSDGKTVTISIASVTGNVVIKVPTVNESGNESTGGGNEDGTGTIVESGTLTGAYLYENSSFNTNMSYSILSDDTNTYFIYDLIPVEADTTYKLEKGRAIFFLTSNKTAIGSRGNLTSGYTNFTFTTPSNCAYISVAFKYSEIQPENVELVVTSTGTWQEKSDTLISSLTSNYTEGVGLASGTYTDSAKEGFYTYRDIPALPDTKYSIPYARSTWFLDADKNALYRLNINTDYADANWTITTQSNVAYISACFSSADITASEAHIVEYEWVATE